MEIRKQPFSDLMTNCYIIIDQDESLIIDPGIGATEWVLENAPNPIAICNTHGHFDHVWSNAELHKTLRVPLACPKEDVFLLDTENYGMQTPPSTPDIHVEPNQLLQLGHFSVQYRHFPGHTPGCSVIEVNGQMFSGDFVFLGSIGRSDFPYSDSTQMKQSLERFLQIDYDMPLHPGHGESSTIAAEQQNIPRWLKYL